MKNRTYIGRQRSGKIIVEFVDDEGRSRFVVWDQLSEEERRWVRLFAIDPLGHLRGVRS